MSQNIAVPFSSLAQASSITNKEILVAEGDALERISLENFAAYFQMFTKIAKPISPSDATPTVIGWYKPSVYSASPGTNYPNLNNLKAVKGFDTLFYFDGTSWTDVVNEMPQAKKNIVNFPDIPSGDFPLVNVGADKIQVVHNENIFQLKDGKTATSTDVPGLSDKWLGISKNDDLIKKSLNLDFSEFGGVVMSPNDRNGEVFTATPLNPGATYFEEVLFFGGNISVNKIFVKSAVSGVATICFIEKIGLNAQVLWAENKNIAIGLNEFELSDFSIPQSVLDKPKINIGISERNSPVGVAVAKNNSNATVLSIPNTGINACSTIAGKMMNIWAELNTADFLIGNYKKIDYLSEYKPDNIYSTINPKDTISDFTGGVSTNTIFGEKDQFLSPKQKLVNFNFKSIRTGSFNILFVSYSNGVGTLVHTSTVNVDVVNVVKSWNANELGLPDLSMHEKVFVFLQNTISDLNLAPVKLSSSGADTGLLAFNPVNGNVNFYQNSIYRLSFWLDVVNDTVNIVEELKEIKTIARNAGSAKIKTYSDLLLAFDYTDYIVLDRGTILLTEPLDIPKDKTITGPRSAIFQFVPDLQKGILANKSGINLYGFSVYGTGQNIDINSTSKINIADDIEGNPTNIGNQIGITIKDGDGSIRDLFLSNFDNAGLYLDDTFQGVGEFPRGFTIDGVITENNYFGIRSDVEGEYSQLNNIKGRKNVCGISVVSGNIVCSNSHFVQNRMGHHLGGALGSLPSGETNNAHGGFSNCTFNHNSLRGVFISGITNGQVYSNCNFFDGIIEVKNSLGVQITGSLIASEIKATMNANQMFKIYDNTFRSDNGYNAGLITKTGAGRLSMKLNAYSNGKDATALNLEL